MGPEGAKRKTGIASGRGLLVAAVAVAFVAVIAVSGLMLSRLGPAGGLASDQASHAAASSQLDQSAKPSIPASPAAEPTQTAEVTPVPPSVVATRASCAGSGRFGSTLSACGMQVTVSLTSNTASGGTASRPYTEPVGFLITAVFSDPALGKSLPTVSVNGGDNPGQYWWTDLTPPMVSGRTYRLVVYERPDAATKLVIGFGLSVSPIFTFN